MKKMFCVAALALMAVLLVACGGGEYDEDTIRGFTRGTWNGNVFTSDQVGVTFTMPDGWVAATDEEMAEVMGLGADMMSGEISPAMLEAAGVRVVQDMMVSNPETGAMVQIMAERLVFPNTRISVPAYIENASEMLVTMGMEVDFDFPNASLGNYTWHVYESAMEIMPGINIYGRYFVDVRDGFAITVQIVYSDFSESVEEILALFR